MVDVNTILLVGSLALTDAETICVILKFCCVGGRNMGDDESTLDSPRSSRTTFKL
jgi:hypothetical protein